MTVKMQTDVPDDVNVAVFRFMREEGIENMAKAHAELLRRGAESEGVL